MALPQAPRNLYANRNDNYTVVKWDKVIKDKSDPPQYTAIIAYYVYKTANPNGTNWELQPKIITDDEFVDKDVFWIDFNPGNYLYRVCAENSTGIGDCAVTYGSIGNPDEIVTVLPCRWDVGKFDVCVWG